MKAAEKPLVSQREFARLRGWNPGYVNRLIKKGTIRLIDGKIDPQQAQADIEAAADPAKDYMREVNQRQRTRRSDPEPAHIEADEAAAPSAHASYQKAKTVREVYNAKRAKLEYEREMGKLIERDEVLAQWTQLIAAARAKLLALPTRIAPRVTGMKNVAQIEDAIRTIVYEALHELAGNGVPDASGEPDMDAAA